MSAQDLVQAVPDSVVDAHLDRVLKASGSALRNYSVASTLSAMRGAMREALGWTPPRAGEIASAADCHLGPLAQAARAAGQNVRVWHNGCGHYVAEAGKPAGIGKTAQEACDRLEIALREAAP